MRRCRLTGWEHPTENFANYNDKMNKEFNTQTHKLVRVCFHGGKDRVFFLCSLYRTLKLFSKFYKENSEKTPCLFRHGNTPLSLFDVQQSVILNLTDWISKVDTCSNFTKICLFLNIYFVCLKSYFVACNIRKTLIGHNWAEFLYG